MGRTLDTPLQTTQINFLLIHYTSTYISEINLRPSWRAGLFLIYTYKSMLIHIVYHMFTWRQGCIIQHMSAQAMLFQTDVLGGSSSLFKVFALDKSYLKKLIQVYTKKLIQVYTPPLCCRPPEKLIQKN